MPTARNRSSRTGEAGSAFIYIILAVVLFAALMFAFTRSARQGGNNMNDQQTQLAASDIISYAGEAERAVGRVMQNGISENQLSFDNTHVTGYANTADDCGSDKCKIFAAAGGALDWEEPSAQAGDATTNWVITGGNAVPGIGDDLAPDLVLLLPGVKLVICTKINDNLKVPNPGGAPPDDTDGIDQTKFTGSFPASATARISDATQVNGVRAACVKSGAGYIFYEVLLER